MLYQRFNFRTTEEAGLVFVPHDSVDDIYEDVWFQIPRHWDNNCDTQTEGRVRRRRQAKGEWYWDDHFTHYYRIIREEKK